MNGVDEVPSHLGRTTEGPSHGTIHFHRFSDWLGQHVILASLIILLFSLSTRLFLTLHSDQNQLIFPDSPTYLTPALSLMKSGSFLNHHNTPEVSRTPGYPVFLAVLMFVAGTELRNLLIAQTILVSLSVLVLYWLARRILPPVMAFTGAVVAALSPWGAVRAGFLLTEGVYLLVLILLFYLMYLVVEHATKLSAVLLGGAGIGLLTSAAVLVRPVWPLVPLVAIVLFLLIGDKRQRAWILAAVVLVCGSTPLYLWKVRNVHEAQFDGLTTISGMAASQWLVAAVKAQLPGADGDRWVLQRAAAEDEWRWSQGLSLQEKYDEGWRRAKAVFREHPFLTVYTFFLNVGQTIIHPDPSILTPAALNFYGDVFVLGGTWVALLMLAGLGLIGRPDKNRDHGLIQQQWLLAILCICLLPTLASGITFGAGSRYRAPLELIVPLLAGVGFVRVGSYVKRGILSLRKTTTGEEKLQPRVAS